MSHKKLNSTADQNHQAFCGHGISSTSSVWLVTACSQGSFNWQILRQTNEKASSERPRTWITSACAGAWPTGEGETQCQGVEEAGCSVCALTDGHSPVAPGQRTQSSSVTRLTLSPTKGAHSCRSKVKPGGHCSTSLLGLAGYKAGHMQTYNVAWPRTEGKHKCGSNPRQVSQWGVSQLFLTPWLSSQQCDPWLHNCTFAELTLGRGKPQRNKELPKLVLSEPQQLSLNIWIYRNWRLGVFQCIEMQLHGKTQSYLYQTSQKAAPDFWASAPTRTLCPQFCVLSCHYTQEGLVALGLRSSWRKIKVL